MFKEFIKRFFTSIILLLIFGFVILNKLFFYFFILIISIIAFKEYSNLANSIKKSFKINNFFLNPILYIGIFYFIGLYYNNSFILPVSIFIIFIYNTILFILKKIKNTYNNLKEKLFAFIYCFVFPSGFFLIYQKNNGLFWILYIVITIIFSDIFAYILGKFFGKTFIIPKISNNKTLEGFFGSLFFGTLIGFIFSFFILKTTVCFSIIISFLLVIVGILGDLFESYLKREANIKDSGNILPGHGGILDRFDSLIFASGFIYFILFYFKI